MSEEEKAKGKEALEELESSGHIEDFLLGKEEDEEDEYDDCCDDE